MKRFIVLLSLVILTAGVAFAQDVPAEVMPQIAAKSADDLTQDFEAFSLVLPNKTWKATSKTSTAAANNVQFIYNDRLDGFLQIRLVEFDEKELISDVIEREQARNLQFLPGFVNGKEETFKGSLSGKVLNYEYTQSGKPMIGRVYFLQSADGKLLYSLRFTGSRDKLKLLRNQTDAISRTFKLKTK